MNRCDLEASVNSAAPGDLIVYHVGNLLADRHQGPHFLQVDNTARGAFSLCEEGKVHLAQKRIGFNVFAYSAIKRKPPHKKIEWTGCYDTTPIHTKAPIKVKAAA